MLANAVVRYGGAGCWGGGGSRTFSTNGDPTGSTDNRAAAGAGEDDNILTEPVDSYLCASLKSVYIAN